MDAKKEEYSIFLRILTFPLFVSLFLQNVLPLHRKDL